MRIKKMGTTPVEIKNDLFMRLQEAARAEGAESTSAVVAREIVKYCETSEARHRRGKERLANLNAKGLVFTKRRSETLVDYNGRRIGRIVPDFSRPGHWVASKSLAAWLGERFDAPTREQMAARVQIRAEAIIEKMNESVKADYQSIIDANVGRGR